MALAAVSLSSMRVSLLTMARFASRRVIESDPAPTTLLDTWITRQRCSDLASAIACHQALLTAGIAAVDAGQHLPGGDCPWLVGWFV